jgi:hypothetical protein
MGTGMTSWLFFAIGGGGYFGGGYGLRRRRQENIKSIHKISYFSSVHL